MKIIGGTSVPSKIASAFVSTPVVEEKIDFSKVKVELLFEEMVDFKRYTRIL